MINARPELPNFLCKLVPGAASPARSTNDTSCGALVEIRHDVEHRIRAASIARHHVINDGKPTEAVLDQGLRQSKMDVLIQYQYGT